MGLAGELWPFFRPNYIKVAEYVQQLNNEIRLLQQQQQTTKSTTTSTDGSCDCGVSCYYDRVVAFIPTGWAHGSKWNREHSISKKTVTLDLDDNDNEESCMSAISTNVRAHGLYLESGSAANAGLKSARFFFLTTTRLP